MWAVLGRHMGAAPDLEVRWGPRSLGRGVSGRGGGCTSSTCGVSSRGQVAAVWCHAQYGDQQAAAHRQVADCPG